MTDNRKQAQVLTSSVSQSLLLTNTNLGWISPIICFEYLIFSTAELMQTKEQFLQGQCIAFPARDNTHTIYIYDIYLLFGTRGGNNWHKQGRGGQVAPAANHARQKSEKLADVFGFPYSGSASLGPRLLLKRKCFFSFISFHSFSQRKAAILCSRTDANKETIFAGVVYCYFLPEDKKWRMDMPQQEGSRNLIAHLSSIF